MPTTEYAALSKITFAFGILPMLVNSYDCSQLADQTRCDGFGEGGYPECLVSIFGASAFIQCASQEDDFKGPDAVLIGKLPPLNVLNDAVSKPACSKCLLAQKIQEIYRDTNGPDFQNFGADLCDKTPSDKGMCCLKDCLGGSPEHSIQALCEGRVNDLMHAAVLQTCDSNAEQNDDGSGVSDSVDGGYSSIVAFSSRPESSTPETRSPTPDPTPVSTVATTSLAVNVPGAASATSTSSSPQVTPDSGAVSGRLMTIASLLKQAGVAVLPILAAL